ncbi:hypothetical protein [Cellulophaga baltica]|uniref:DUF4836 family protein n=1 Tax=Cellulophaga baltica 18 TaxID=1348584 RepID=A0AAU8RDA6_9FLAO|nr:hypothetical protein [Cellulophaga baltica]AIZ40873.1 hypothetical protein M666_04410 [Cellulophaga baltica 18]
MKKFLKITLSLLGIAVIGYFIYVQYQKSASLKNRIHVNADSVLKVGLHDFQKTILLDALSSPMFYWDNADFSSSSKDDEDKKEDKNGINLKPYSLVFYTMKEVKNTLFTTLPIKDSEAFNAYALAYLTAKKVTIIEGDYTYALDEKTKIIYAWNNENLAIAYAPKKSFELCKPVFDDVLLNKKLISDTDHPYLKSLIAADDHVTYVKDSSVVHLNFNDGNAYLSGVMYTAQPKEFNESMKYVATPEASLLLYVDANFSNTAHASSVTDLLKDFSFFEKNNIEADSLVAKSTGIISLAVKGTTLQTDSIVTYEYDDNFDKVATVALQEKEAPSIFLNIASDTTLKSYLKKQGAIENGVLKALPMYSFYEKDTTSEVSFSTQKETLNHPFKTGSYFFSLSANFKSLQKDLKIPKADKLAALLKTVRINAQQVEGNKIVLEGSLTAENNEINIISQLYFGLQKTDSIP